MFDWCGELEKHLPRFKCETIPNDAIKRMLREIYKLKINFSYKFLILYFYIYSIIFKNIFFNTSDSIPYNDQARMIFLHIFHIQENDQARMINLGRKEKLFDLKNLILRQKRVMSWRN